jgi:hypothetical protein
MTTKYGYVIAEAAKTTWLLRVYWLMGYEKCKKKALS